MAEFHEFYGAPLLYDVAFSRPVTQEIDFISELYQSFNSRQLESFLEVACGPAYHALEFAKRGIKSCGLDLEANMINFARQRAREQSLSCNFFTADMRSFSAPNKVDVAAAMFDGIDSLLTIEEHIKHFTAVATALNEGGIYVMENAHPKDVNMLKYDPIVYHGKRDDLSVSITFGGERPNVDLTTQSAKVSVDVAYQKGDQSGLIQSSAVERFTTVQELAALAKCTGMLELVGAWGAFDLDIPFRNTQEADRMIVVLRKTAS